MEYRAGGLLKASGTIRRERRIDGEVISLLAFAEQHLTISLFFVPLRSAFIFQSVRRLRQPRRRTQPKNANRQAKAFQL